MSKIGRYIFEQQEQEEVQEYYGEIKRKLNETNHENKRINQQNIPCAISSTARNQVRIEGRDEPAF